YLSDFIRTTTEAGLSFLGDMRSFIRNFRILPPEVQKAAATGVISYLEVEQICDYLQNRSFRRALLCREGFVPDFAKIRPTLPELFVSTDFHKGPTEQDKLFQPIETFIGPKGQRFGLPPGVHCEVMLKITEEAPQQIQIAKLLEGMAAQSTTTTESPREQATSFIIEGISQGFMNVSLSPIEGLARALTNAPLVHPFVKYQAKNADLISNPRLQMVPLEQAARTILQICDGTRTRSEIKGKLSQSGAKYSTDAENVFEYLRRNGLLMEG
ncbi:MAG: methyltransferase regulatory domain-containing protein, partial [Bdellovibrionales bacterium]|nr:methyltransferase regulatory domain-containing protein [Bdellovibrionales bacterium]